MKLLKSLTILFFLTLESCATHSKVAQDVSLGMSSLEVKQVAGKPFSKNSYYDQSGNHVEEWLYKETTWDDGGWSWDRTIVNSTIVLENDKVVSCKNSGERFKTKNPMSPSLNIDTTLHVE